MNATLYTTPLAERIEDTLILLWKSAMDEDTFDGWRCVRYQISALSSLLINVCHRDGGVQDPALEALQSLWEVALERGFMVSESGRGD
jgi:hypothetical protein